MKVCKRKRCKGPIRNVTPLMMGPSFKCEKCETIYDRNGYIWNSKEMRMSGCYRTIKYE